MSFTHCLKYNLVLAEPCGIGTDLPSINAQKILQILPVFLDLSLVKSFVVSINTDLYQS
jgi:hypothetical protein